MPHSQVIRQLALAATLVLPTVTASAANCNAANFATFVACAAGAGNGDTITLTANAQPDGTPVPVNADVTLVNNGFLLDGAGQLVKSGTGTLTLPSNNTYSGGTTILSGSIAVAAGGAMGSGLLVLQGGGGVLALGSLALATSGVTFGPVSSGRIAAVSGQTLALSNVILGASATATFGDAVNNGTLEFGGAGSVTSTSTVTLAGGTARALNSMLPTLLSAESATLGSTALLDTNAQNFIIQDLFGAGEIALSGGNLLILYNGTYAGVISGDGSLQKEVTAGTVTLSGTNTYSGSTAILGGILRIGDGGTTGTLGTGPVINNRELSYNRTDAYEISQPISGSGTLRVENSGTLTLSAPSNFFLGPTQVDIGTLSVTGIIQSTLTTVATNGTLKGTGQTGNAVVNLGTLRPGLSPGILEIGSLTLSPLSTLDVDILGPVLETQYDQLRVVGSTTLNNATLNVVLGFTPTAGQTFTILANDLADAVVGTFSGLPEGSIFAAGAGHFRISYVGGNGNDVTLTAIGPPTIAKAFGTPSILVNETTTLTFTLINANAGTALSGVGFTDTLPTGLVVGTPNGLASTCGGAVTAGAGSSSIGLVNGGLAAGGSCAITVNVTGTAAGLKRNATSAVTSTEGGTGGTAVAFLVVVAPPAVAPPTIAKAFGAAHIVVNGTTTLTFTLTNPNPEAALSGVGFTDTLPAGLVVGTPNGLASTCGGTVTAVAGTGSVGLANGGLPTSGSCTITLNVTGTTAGVKDNTTSAVTSTEGGTGGTASASLAVIAPPTIAKAFGAASIVVNGTTTLTFALTNPNPGIALSGVGFTDTLPAGLVVGTPNGLTSTCGGTVTAVAGAGSVGLVNGGVAPGGSCTITVNVTGTTPGAKDNTTSAVTSTEGGMGGIALASLAVVAPPTIAKAFGAESIGLNETTTLTFTVANPAGNGAALTGVAFTDALPAGLVVATPNGLTGSCGGGTITAAEGTTSISLAGATLAAGTSCVFSINVQAVAAGTQVNTTSPVTSANGGAGNAATASITVQATAPMVQVPTLSPFALAVLAIMVMLIGLRRIFAK